jgi:hypothetical protein
MGIERTMTAITSLQMLMLEKYGEKIPCENEVKGLSDGSDWNDGVIQSITSLRSSFRLRIRSSKYSRSFDTARSWSSFFIVRNW